MTRPGNYFDDDEFQDFLVALLCRDQQTLKCCAHLLDPNDFQPLRGSRDGRARWIVAERALMHWRKHQQPIHRLLRSDVLEYADSIGLGERGKAELESYLQRVAKAPLAGADAAVEKVAKFKRERIRAKAIDEIVELHAANQLDDAKWNEILRRAQAADVGLSDLSADYYGGLEDRMERRAMEAGASIQRAPLFLIDPLDAMVRGLAAGQLGVVMAPPGRGKSLFLQWLSVAYTLQRLNTVLVTLEDPREEVEDRLDSVVSGVACHRLGELPRTVEKRFARFLRLVRARLKIIDGTQGGVTVDRLEQMLMQERAQGFVADALIVDYDDEIAPARKQKERRFEFADIYRDFRQLVARRHLIGWTGAQTQRGTEALKVLSGDKVAEDISKIRKVTMAVGLGKGDWGQDSVYLWVAKHKFDRQHVGCHVVPDLERMRIYDRELTRRAQAEHGPDSGVEDDE